MKRKLEEIDGHRWLFAGLLFAIIYWIAESLLHVKVFHTGNFRESLFPVGHFNEIWMRSFIGLLFLLLGMGADRMIYNLKKADQEQKRLIAELQESANKIKTLRGLLPICSVCKKVKDDTGYWQQVETYLHNHSEADFEQGYCPECAKEILQGITD